MKNDLSRVSKYLLLGSAIVFLSWLIWRKNTQSVQEYWRITLNGTNIHQNCGGQFHIDGTIDLLYTSSLAKAILRDATLIPVNVSSYGVYSSTETLVQQTPLAETKLLPSEIKAMGVFAQSSWLWTGSGALLQTVLTSAGPLLNAFCEAKNVRVEQNFAHALVLEGTSFNANMISGHWSVAATEANNPAMMNANGTFQMHWIAGGSSGVEIPDVIKSINRPSPK